MLQFFMPAQLYRSYCAVKLTICVQVRHLLDLVDAGEIGAKEAIKKVSCLILLNGLVFAFHKFPEHYCCVIALTRSRSHVEKRQLQAESCGLRRWMSMCCAFWDSDTIFSVLVGAHFLGKKLLGGAPKTQVLHHHRRKLRVQHLLS